MENDKVIIERKKLEEMEKRLAEFESGREVIKIEMRWTHPLFSPVYTVEPESETIYVGKDAAIETIAKYANLMKTRMSGYRDDAEYGKSLKLRISTASFFDRLKYLFTKEL